MSIRMFASIAQWLEPRSSNPAVVSSSPGGGGHVPAMLRARYGSFQTTATFQRLHHLSCLCKSGYLCTEADLLKYCYLLR